MKRTEFGATFDRKLVIDWLRRMREQRGLSVRKLARLVNVSHSTLSRMESGKGIIHMDLYFKITQVLDIDPSEGIGLMAQAQS